MSRSEYYKTNKQERKYGDFISKRIDKFKKIEVIRKLIKSDKFYLAKDIIDEYFEKYGEDDYINHELAKYYARINEFEKAKSIFEELVLYSDTKYYSMYEYAKMERGNGNFDKAEELLNQIIISDHDNKEHALLELGKLYIDKQNYDAAKTILNQIIDADLSNKELAYQPLLIIALDEKDYEKAKEYFEKIKDILPKKDVIYYEAYMLYIRGKMVSAEKKLKNTDLGIGRNRLLFCQIEFELKKYDELIEYIEPNVDTRYNNSYNSVMKSSIVLLSNVYIKECKEEEAINSINRLKEFKDPDYDQINYLLGALYYNLNDHEVARKFFDQIKNRESAVFYFSILTKIGMLIGENRYEEAYALLNNNYKELLEKDQKSICHIARFFLENKLSIQSSIKPVHYTEFQMTDYSKESALEHIEKHFTYNKNSERSQALFNENINKEELFDYVTSVLCDDYIYRRDITDIYYIPYENASASSEKKCNHIKVVTLHDTHNIITMYPVRKIKENYKVLKKNK